MEKAVVIVSGGMDSVTLLHWAKRRYDLEVLTFNYGSKHNAKEGEMAKWQCEQLSVPHKVIKMDWNEWGFKSDLLQLGGAIPEGHYAEDSMKATVVPYRNGIMLAIAAGFADSKDISKVLLGSHRGDQAQYPDCSEEFTRTFSLATSFGTHNKVEIESPFNRLMKWDILRIGIDLGVDYSKTYSCYKGQDRPCTVCGTCVERTESFVRNKKEDPLLTMIEWDSAVRYMQQALDSFNQKVKV